MLVRESPLPPAPTAAVGVAVWFRCAVGDGLVIGPVLGVGCVNVGAVDVDSDGARVGIDEKGAPVG